MRFRYDFDIDKYLYSINSSKTSGDDDDEKQITCIQRNTTMGDERGNIRITTQW